MSYEFKKISDVDVIESISDNTNVLVEENGAIVKIAANNMNIGGGNSNENGNTVAPVIFSVSGRIFKDGQPATVNQVVEAYFAGNMYAKDISSGAPSFPQKVLGFFISNNYAYIQFAHTASIGSISSGAISECTKSQLQTAIDNYLGV